MSIFSELGSGESFLSKGFQTKQIYVALDENNNFLGFVYIIMNGTFYRFPFLHVIAIAPQHRNKGIGTKLLNYFKNLAFENADKIFLTVAEFNPKARQLYESLGYLQVGFISSLYRDGVSEFLTMKKSFLHSN